MFGRLLKLNLTVYIICLCACLQFSVMSAQDRPMIDCMQVAPGGDVTLNWTPPAGGLPGFAYYEVVYSISPDLVFTSVATNLTPLTLGTHTHITNLTLNNSYYYAVVAWYDDGSGTLVASSSDTLRTIHLDAALATTMCPNCSGIPWLEWNSPFTDSVQAMSGVFEVYSDYPNGVMEMITTVGPDVLDYLHYIYNCLDAQMNFMVKFVTPGGCEFISNIDGDQFRDGVKPTSGLLSSIVVMPNDDAVIEWQPSLDPDVQDYIVYRCDGNNNIQIDVVPVNQALQYTDQLAQPANGPLMYAIAARDFCMNKDTTTCIANLFLSVQTYVDCEEKIDISWTPFSSVFYTPSHYIVRKGISTVNDYSSVVFDIIDTVTAFNYSDYNLQTGYYNFYQIESLDTLNQFRSRSNIKGTFVPSNEPPAELQIDFATVNNDSILIWVSLSPTANSFDYELQMLDTFTGVWEESIVQTANAQMQLSYVVNDLVTDEFPYQFRVVAYNSCGVAVDTTNRAKTIWLNGISIQERLVNMLSWTPYEDWPEGVERYNIYRQVGDGPIELLTEVSSATAPFYEDDVSELTDSKGDFRYYIEAVERSSSSRAPFTSVSNEILLSIDPIIWIPNAIVIGGYNELFFPVISFADIENYRLVVFSRWGDLIYETDDLTQGWDGTMGDRYVQEGMYNYYLSVQDGRGRHIDRFGYITVLNYD